MSCTKFKTLFEIENQNSLYFGKITSFRNPLKRALKRKNLSCTSARDFILQVLQQVSIKAKITSLHSSRLGGTSAEDSAGENDRLFK